MLSGTFTSNGSLLRLQQNFFVYRDPFIFRDNKKKKNSFSAKNVVYEFPAVARFHRYYIFPDVRFLNFKRGESDLVPKKAAKQEQKQKQPL